MFVSCPFLLCQRLLAVSSKEFGQTGLEAHFLPPQERVEMSTQVLSTVGLRGTLGATGLTASQGVSIEGVIYTTQRGMSQNKGVADGGSSFWKWPYRWGNGSPLQSLSAFASTEISFLSVAENWKAYFETLITPEGTAFYRSPLTCFKFDMSYYKYHSDNNLGS